MSPSSCTTGGRASATSGLASDVPLDPAILHRELGTHELEGTSKVQLQAPCCWPVEFHKLYFDFGVQTSPDAAKFASF